MGASFSFKREVSPEVVSFPYLPLSAASAAFERFQKIHNGFGWGIDRATFSSLYSSSHFPTLSAGLAQSLERTFELFDDDGNGITDILEIISCQILLSDASASSSSFASKFSVLFTLFDLDCNSVLSPTEISILFKTSLSGLCKALKTKEPKEESVNARIAKSFHSFGSLSSEQFVQLAGQTQFIKTFMAEIELIAENARKKKRGMVKLASVNGATSSTSAVSNGSVRVGPLSVAFKEEKINENQNQNQNENENENENENKAMEPSKMKTKTPEKETKKVSTGTVLTSPKSSVSSAASTPKAKTVKEEKRNRATPLQVDSPPQEREFGSSGPASPSGSGSVPYDPSSLPELVKQSPYLMDRVRLASIYSLPLLRRSLQIFNHLTSSAPASPTSSALPQSQLRPHDFFVFLRPHTALSGSLPGLPSASAFPTSHASSDPLNDRLYTQFKLHYSHSPLRHLPTLSFQQFLSVLFPQLENSQSDSPMFQRHCSPASLSLTLQRINQPLIESLSIVFERLDSDFDGKHNFLDYLLQLAKYREIQWLFEEVFELSQQVIQRAKVVKYEFMESLRVIFSPFFDSLRLEIQTKGIKSPSAAAGTSSAYSASLSPASLSLITQINLDTVLKWADSYPVKALSSRQQSELEELFHLYDLDSSGSINLKELQAHFRDLGFARGTKSDLERIEAILKQYDDNESQTLDVVEFKRFYRNLWKDSDAR